MRRRNWIKCVIVLLIMGIIIFLAFDGGESIGINGISKTRTGIDIKGGIYTTLYPDLPEGQKPTEDELNSARAIIEKRLESKGIYDKNVTVEKEHGRIIVEIPFAPGETDFNPQKAIEEIGRTALLTFQEVDESKVDENSLYLPTGKIVIEGKDVKNAGVARYPDTGEIVVTLELNEEGKQKFAEATERLKGERIAIFMDDELIVAPVVNEVIPDGNAVITGQRSAKEAGELADTIRAGALPFRMVPKEINSVSPILGENALRVTIRAGILAYILIFIFMVVIYKLAGIIAGIALGMLAITTLLFISATGNTLTLPGIAGLILSIGMGVDANVIIFERIKEELRNGKTIGAAIDDGFHRAFTAVLDSNVTTLITAVVLYWLGSGPIRGFSITLGVGVVISFLTAVTASRIMLKAFSSESFAKNPKLYGA
ncbi:MAG TPA: protein translocase subunit SecD [Clostridiaceae bacterium]|nr:protein translocase subunit SecD [Clostridiaceae bacterium]